MQHNGGVHHIQTQCAVCGLTYIMYRLNACCVAQVLLGLRKHSGNVSRARRQEQSEAAFKAAERAMSRLLQGCGRAKGGGAGPAGAEKEGCRGEGIPSPVPVSLLRSPEMATSVEDLAEAAQLLGRLEAAMLERLGCAKKSTNTSGVAEEVRQSGKNILRGCKVKGNGHKIREHGSLLHRYIDAPDIYVHVVGRRSRSKLPAHRETKISSPATLSIALLSPLFVVSISCTHEAHRALEGREQSRSCSFPAQRSPRIEF